METCVGTYFLKDDNLLPVSSFAQHLPDISDSVYEVIRIIDSIPLFLEEHIQRLNNSAEYLGITLPQCIMNAIKCLVDFNQMPNGNVKLLLKQFEYHGQKALHWFMYFIPHHYPAEQDYQRGVSLILFRAERNNPNIKAPDVNLRSNINEELKQREAYEALLVDSNDIITEGSRSNVFWVRDGQIYTAARHRILPGITREAIVQLCVKMGHRLVEGEISIEHLPRMEAAFITGTSPKVLPVKSIDHLVFESASHPIVLDMIRGYNQMIDDYIKQRS